MGWEGFLVLAAVGRAASERAEEDLRDVAAAARGEQTALARLYERYARFVYSLAVRVTEESAAAEEVTQDVFLQFWRRASSFDPARGDLLGWLVTITRNRAIDYRRSRQQRLTTDSVALEEARDWATAPITASLETADRVRKQLAALPEQQRRVIELAYYQGLTQTEIARALNQPLGTVKTWTRSALTALRHALR